MSDEHKGKYDGQYDPHDGNCFVCGTMLDVEGDCVTCDKMQLKKFREAAKAMIATKWFHHGTLCVNEDEFNDLAKTLDEG
jgi:hypothetical protein